MLDQKSVLPTWTFNVHPYGIHWPEVYPCVCGFIIPMFYVASKQTRILGKRRTWKWTWNMAKNLSIIEETQQRRNLEHHGGAHVVRPCSEGLCVRADPEDRFT